MISDFLHPVWKQRVLGGSDLNSVILKSIDDELTEAQMDLIQSKLSLYVNTAQDTFLDYWGKWLGLSRVDGWEDDVYREKIINHVLHSRNTIESLREAIANFIQTNEDNIYVYEPYVDMFIWNYSTYNSLSFFSDEYYRYMVIDVKISTPFTQDVSKIINLFRPAGVLWIMSLDINGYSDALNIINYSINGSSHNYTNITEYSGFSNKISYNINPSIDTTSTTIDPFTYNDPNSTWNGGKAYYKVSSYLDNYMYLGLNQLNGNPDPSIGFKDSRNYVTQLDVDSNNMMSSKNNNGHTFLLGQDPTLNPNLLIGTGTSLSFVTNGNYNQTSMQTGKSNYYLVDGLTTYQLVQKYGIQFTISFDWEFVGDSATGKFDVQWDNNPWYIMPNSIDLSNGTSGHYSVTFDLNTVQNDTAIGIQFRSDNTLGTLNFSHIKLEKGSVATDWCPNPSDRLDVSLIGATYMGALSPYILASLSLSNGMVAVGTNLILNSAGPFQPNLSQIDNNLYAYDSTVTLSKGVKYTLSAKTNGVFSSVHDTTVDSDKAIIWIFSNDNTQYHIISDENTTTGTTFTLDQYGLNEGEYYIRVNGYHANNSTWIKEIKIEVGSVATPWIPNIADPSFVANTSTLGHVYLNNRIKNQSNYPTQVNIRLYNSTLGLWIIYDSFLLNPNIYYDSIIDITNEFKSLINSQGVFYYKIEPVTIDSDLYLNVDYTGMSFSTKTRNPVGSFYTSFYDSEVVMGS